MTDQTTRLDLSVIGMEVIGPGIIDLDAFGFQVFRGLKTSVPPDQKNYPTDALKKVITKTIQTASMDLNSVGVVTFQTGIKGKIGDLEIGIKLKEAHRQNNRFESAWHTAADWLDSGEIDAVLIIENDQDDYFYSSILVCSSHFAIHNSKQVFAVINCISEHEESINNNSLRVLIKSVLKTENLQSEKVGLILASASLESAPEIISPHDLICFFPSHDGPSCALTDGQSGLSSVIKAVWCLYNRVVPGSSAWKVSENPQIWKNSSFYIPTESRTWFTSASNQTRKALIINSNQGETSSVFLIQEGGSIGVRINTALHQEPFYLLPASGSTLAKLQHELELLKGKLASTPDLFEFCNEKLTSFQTLTQSGDLVASILGHTREELGREIDYALRGIPSAYEKNSEWRTPLGSYLTTMPLGETGMVSFVYPGAFNSYPGVGRDLFYLFPSLYNRLNSISSNLSDLLNEKMLYPRSISALTSADLEKAERRLSDDPLAMLISGTSLAALFTFLLRDIFEIHPASAFGYSLGEISMMFASGAWTEPDETSSALRASSLFQTRLAGPQNAIRESWNLPIVNQPDPENVIFSNFVLMADPESVNLAIKNENRVFMTHINTPRQVVIAGDPAACRKVIEALKCNSLQAPFNYALHCDAMVSEYSDLQSLLSWPVSNHPDMILYSAAGYQAMPIEQKTIASQLAYGLCHQLDFPRLINQAYSDGARIFIELGAGSNCARWVDESLKDKPHAAFSINRKGLDDHAAVLQLLAKLISHHVPVNLSALLS